MGFLRGILAGVVFAGPCLAVASLLAPQPAGNEPPRAPQTSTVAPIDAAPTDAASQPAAPIQDAPSMERPVPPATSAQPEQPSGIDTTPAQVPQTSATPSAPEQSPPAGEPAAPSAAQPVLPSPQAPRPVIPDLDGSAQISIDPAQPMAPVTEDTYLVLDEAALEMPQPEVPNVDETASDPGGSADDAPTQAGTARFQDAVPVRRSDAAPEDTADEEAPAVSPAALIANAAPFTAQSDMPQLAIVMIDSAQMGLDPQSVAALGVPISVAVRASAPDFRARATAYRAAGLELLILSDLPAGVTPSDVAISMEASLADLPDTVGVLDAGLGGFDGNEQLISVAVSRLQQSGHGFVSLGTALDPALRLAQGRDVPAVRIDIDLDAADQPAQVLRRFLDQAAFQARQRGQAVVLTRLRPETLSALQLWSQAERAQSVQITPVSALMIQQLPDDRR